MVENGSSAWARDRASASAKDPATAGRVAQWACALTGTRRRGSDRTHEQRFYLQPTQEEQCLERELRQVSYINTERYWRAILYCSAMIVRLFQEALAACRVWVSLSAVFILPRDRECRFGRQRSDSSCLGTGIDLAPRPFTAFYTLSMWHK